MNFLSFLQRCMKWNVWLISVKYLSMPQWCVKKFRNFSSRHSANITFQCWPSLTACSAVCRCLECHYGRTASTIAMSSSSQVVYLRSAGVRICVRRWSGRLYPLALGLFLSLLHSHHCWWCRSNLKFRPAALGRRCSRIFPSLLQMLSALRMTNPTCFLCV